MGLTIHYEIRAPEVASMKEARFLLAKLHRFAKGLVVGSCSELIEWNHLDDDSEIGARHSHFMPAAEESDGSDYLVAEALELVKFSINHPGSETASFGLAKYAPVAVDRGGEIASRPTGLTGWNWHQFCKTQYASLPSHGGWDNFFAIHDGICRIFDHAVLLGMQVEVRDDGGYWEGRDVATLRAEVDRWNELIAAFTGKFKDMIGDRAEGAVIAPITQDPSFEAMEARGQKHLRDSKDRGA